MSDIEYCGKLVRKIREPRLWYLVTRDLSGHLRILYMRGHGSYNGTLNPNFEPLTFIQNECEIICDLTYILSSVAYAE
jgi:hypothetical protein